MYYFIYPDSDTTIYEGSLTQSLNAGQDPIIEVQKLVDDSGTIVQNSRALIRFDYSDIVRKRNSNVRKIHNFQKIMGRACFKKRKK